MIRGKVVEKTGMFLIENKQQNHFTSQAYFCLNKVERNILKICFSNLEEYNNYCRDYTKESKVIGVQQRTDCDKVA